MTRAFRMTCLAVFLFTSFACSEPEEAGDDPSCEGLTACAGDCVDTQSDAKHCGECGASCDEGQVCRAGSCVTECESGERLCGETCVDTLSDAKHCGGCDEACDEGQACVGGACSDDACEEEEFSCGGRCVDVASDASHCGECDNACDDGWSCVNGQCEEPSSCSDGETECGGGCVDTQSDAQHCGGCDIPCPDGATCDGGTCHCPGEELACGGACVDTEANPAHCGDCDISCVGQANSSGGECKEGSCELTCDRNFFDCDNDPENGCELDGSEDIDNCGGCGIECLAKPRVTDARCEYGSCIIVSCEEGWGNCDLVPDNGCEAEFAVEPTACGDCFTDCTNLPNSTGPYACNAGVCDLHCADGWGDCDDRIDNGCEVSLLTDDDNCGECGIVCAADETCTEGVCVNRHWAQWPMPPDYPSDDNYVSDTAAGTVTDKTTGLTWQNEVLYRPKDLEDATSYCGNLTQGGASDWRVPSLIELVTLLDLSQKQPNASFNPTHFLNMTYSPEYLSSTMTYAGDNHLSMSGGGFTGNFTEKEYQLLCVRGGKPRPGPRFILDPSGETVSAPKTGLMWQKKAGDETFTWQEAKVHCEGLVLAGHSDWRLPSLKELATLVDPKSFLPTLDGNFFPDEPSNFYWAATPAEYEGGAWAVMFIIGSTFTQGDTSPFPVRCVRDL